MKKIVFWLLLMLTPSFGQTSADLIDRIQQLEARQRQLNGQVEQLQNQITQQEAKMKRQAEDNELRFQDLEKRKGASATPAPSTPAKPVATPTGGGPSNNPQSGGISGLIPDSPEEQFNQGKAHVEKGELEKGDAVLRLFLDKNAKDKNAGDANYYIGEVYYKRRQYKEAAQYFLKVSTDFPKAVKHPNAHLRLGQSFYAFGDRESACTAYGEMSRKFPKLSPTLKTAMENEVKRAKC